MRRSSPTVPTRRSSLYLEGVYRADTSPVARGYPFTLPFVERLNVRFPSSVTFFVGENGSGKSTLLEAIADLCGYDVKGGGRDDRLGTGSAASPLSAHLRPRFLQRPRDGYFFRAETLASFADLLDERKRDPYFWGDPYERYGGTSLHSRSHGEAFLAVLRNRIREGLYLLDEPEAALSPTRQLAFAAFVAERAKTGRCQFLIATHAPILLTLPGAAILSFDEPGLPVVELEETEHYRVTREVLSGPERYWQRRGEMGEEP